MSNVLAMTKLPGLKQFRQDGCVSHFVFDSTSRELVVIDPRADLMQDYRAYIAEHRLRPLLVIDTRLHWHHLSGSHFFASEFQVPIAMSARTESARATRNLNHGDSIEVGSIQLRTLETPGVSPDAISLSVGHGLLFTGDTLLIEAGARVDQLGADPHELWRSQREILGEFSDATIILPGHDSNDRLFSILGVERSRNPDLASASPEEVTRLKAASPVRHDPELRARLQYNSSVTPTECRESHFGGNSAAATEISEGRRVASISVDKYLQKMREHAGGTCFLDVREPEEFSEGHIPGTMNIPLSELALHLKELQAFGRIYVSCQAGRRSVLAAKTLDYLGLPDVVNVSGGIQAWVHSGYPVQTGK